MGFDYRVTWDGGSIVLLTPVSDAAKAWVEDHLPEDRMTLGPAVAIEARYAGPILVGMEDDGLVQEFFN